MCQRCASKAAIIITCAISRCVQVSQLPFILTNVCEIAVRKCRRENLKCLCSEKFNPAESIETFLFGRLIPPVPGPTQHKETGTEHVCGSYIDILLSSLPFFFWTLHFIIRKKRKIKKVNLKRNTIAKWLDPGEGWFRFWSPPGYPFTFCAPGFCSPTPCSSPFTTPGFVSLDVCPSPFGALNLRSSRIWIIINNLRSYFCYVKEILKC